MLLIDLVRRARRPRGGESGSTLAAVVSIVMVTGVVTLSLLTTTIFTTGFTSASRASVQAQAAAEGGVDYAAANLALCTAGTITSPAGTLPRFSVTVEHRSWTAGAWTAGCAPRGAVEIRLVSTGYAAARGVANHTRGDQRTMTAVLRNRFPRAIVGDRFIENSGSLKLPTVSGRPSDIATNGNFRCNGTLVHVGTVHVGGTYTHNNCTTQGTLVTGTDPEAEENVFPRLRKDDRRWPTATRTLAEVAAAFGSTGTNPCALVSSRATVVLAHEPIVVDATGCANGYETSLSTTLVLYGDVVIFAEKFSTTDRKLLTVTSGDGKPHVLHIVKPWPADRVGGCPATPPRDFSLMGNIHSGDMVAHVMVYSSTGIYSGPNASHKFPGQMYGCSYEMSGGTEITFVPLGPMVLLSARDVTG